MRLLPFKFTHAIGVPIAALLMSLGILLIAVLLVLPSYFVYALFARYEIPSKQVFLVMLSLMAGSELAMILAIYFYFDNWHVLKAWMKIVPADPKNAVKHTFFGATGGAICSVMVSIVSRYLDIGVAELTFSPLDATIITISMLAIGLSEEMVFRGFLQQALTLRLGFLKAVMISSAIFALVHLEPYTMPIIFVIGLLIGTLYEKSNRTLAGPITFHTVYNSIQILLPLILC